MRPCAMVLFWSRSASSFIESVLIFSSVLCASATCLLASSKSENMLSARSMSLLVACSRSCIA